MTIQSSVLALAAALALCATVTVANAQTATPKKPTAKKAAPAKKIVEPPAPVAAGAEQIDAAGRVFYGVYDCEFKQTVDIAESSKYPAYVDVKHGKAEYLMKPVLSSTGAIRLEDVRGETLMVQISSKSMLLNVKTAQRIIDDCVSPKQRELIEAARVAKAAEVAAAAASATSAVSAAPAAAAATAAALTGSAPTQTK